MAWENRELTEAQIDYAACDVYVSLLLYNELSKFSIPRALSTKPPASAPILLYHTDNTLVIAYGRLSAPSNISEIDGIQLSVRTVLLEVTEVLVPATIISTHNKRALKDLLELPDVTLWKRMTSLGFEPRTFPIRGDALTTELSGLV